MQQEYIVRAYSCYLTWEIILVVPPPHMEILFREELFGTEVDEQVPNIGMQRIVHVDASPARIKSGSNVGESLFDR